MKTNTRIFLPISLGLMLSACSTSSSQDSTNSIATDAIESPPAATMPISVNETTAKNVSQNQNQNQEQGANQVLINDLQKKLSDNQKQLAALNLSLDEKDRRIASLQNASPSAETLATLEEQKKIRADLESNYAALQLDNDLLRRRIAQLENENSSLKQQISTLENMPTSDDGFKQSYFDLLDVNADLQKKYANLEMDNEAYRKQLTALKKENLILGGALSEARAQHQILWDRIRVLTDSSTKSPETDNRTADINDVPAVTAIPNRPNVEIENANLRSTLAKLEAQIAEQKNIITEYQSDVLKLESALDENADYEARWKQLDAKLAEAQKENALLNVQLLNAEKNQQTVQAELDELTARLSSTLQTLESKENEGISIGAFMDSLQSQIRSTLNNVQWQLPNEIALHNNFEIIVSADVQPSLSGQTYQAELVTDSDIQMVSDRIASAVVQNGRLQWRWRVAGLNEKPEAQLNLFVRQQINIQGQPIQRQIYRGSQTLSLINTNLFEKYGFWGGAILLGLIGGFLIGRVNKSKNTV
ncbi:MAG: hypothetical protein ACPGRG_01680 [Marinomonas sp.]